ncbi:carboxypeptidase-like regulatory domain-containing protein [Geopsychrobacter electrodiphilus]|uniref:carboxypeptidase-like regulatory domain-containing protein n=1 Tax=Geopsychrobacter electrodiphilus TaxID=225196 RepID=UPI00037E2FF0|nr:carboxypeptidase-like regulatory domain-containing protein [Geopsychrobacter electrodiphilus]
MRLALCCCLTCLTLLPACTTTISTTPGGDQVISRMIDGQGQTGISGQVRLKADTSPMAGAYVNIYPNTISNLLGPSQFLSAPTDAAGRYLMELPPGNYYVVARKRLSGLANGPITTGDYYSDHQRILAQVASGKLTQVDLEMLQMRAPMFFKKNLSDTKTDTGIRGVLLDEQGNPLPGGFAIAYVDNNLQRLPDYASTLSNQKGEFTLYLPKGGSYFLAARIKAWDMPHKGEPYGKYGGESALELKIKDNSFVEGIKIRLAPFTGTYKEMNNQRPL